MNVTKKIIALIVLAGFALSGCQLKLTEAKKIDCTKIEQSCIQERWSGIPIDTTAAYRDVAGEYYVIQPVKQINSPENEWSISFINAKKGILTFSDADQNRVMMVSLPSENRAVMESGVGIPVEGNVGAFSIRGSKCAFALSQNNPVLGNSSVFTADLEGNVLTDVVNLGDILRKNVLAWESHPAFSPDGKVIFFASNRWFENGAIDLWFTVKLSDGSWSAPINCGDSINTACNELTPFVSENGKKLLFASSGHKTVGGYDLFEARISDEFWKAVKNNDIEALKSRKDFFYNVENMRPPVNTPGDELFPTSPGNPDDILYYSSNQNDKKASILSRSGGFDMFIRKKVHKVKQHKDSIKAITDNFDYKTDDVEFTNRPLTFDLPKYTLTGYVFNARTGQPASNAELTIREIRSKPPIPSYAEKILKDTSGKYKIVELEKDREFEVSTQGQDLSFESFKLKKDKEDTVIVVKTNKNGEYVVELEKDREFEVTAQAPDLFFESYKIRVDKKDTASMIMKTFRIPEELVLRINFPSAKYDEPYKYALDSNGVETSMTWEEEMNLLAKNIIASQNLLNKIILIGHTDYVGSVEANNKLGYDRVSFVKKELVKRGVPDELLDVSSKGKLVPLPLRKGERKESDIYKRRLRRVELQKVMKN